MKQIAAESENGTFINKEIEALEKAFEPIRKDVFNTVNKVLRLVRGENSAARTQLINWYKGKLEENKKRYGSHLYSASKYAVTNIEAVAPTYGDDERIEDGRLILRDNFMKLFEKHPEIITFGEDTGKIGGVNQSMEGMQEKFGEIRVSDTGIRENTILGQGIGMALRGLRPIAEIQYLDYLLYAIQVISDDLATVQYRTKGGQKAPGIHVCVPRNMTQAAGMYNTLIEADEPALVIEPLNGYRVKEAMPTNLGEYKTPLGKVDVVKEGTDLTLVSYGSTFNIAAEAVKELEKAGISVELIDVQTLLPFDLNHDISKSLEKTSRLMIVDEDVSSGASAYILDQVLVKQKAYYLLDSEPVTVSANDHRPAYGTDGDYFSKPNIDDIYAAAYKIMNEADPKEFPSFLDL